MPLIAAALASVCMSTVPGTYDEACNKALEAGTKQTGIYQQSEHIEGKTTEYFTEEGVKTFGKSAATAIALGPYLYRSYRTKTLKFKLPNVGFCDEITNEITQNSYGVKITWRW